MYDGRHDPYLSHVAARITQDLVGRRPGTTVDHRVERAFVESHVDRVGSHLLHVADVRPAPFDALLFRVPRSHEV